MIQRRLGTCIAVGGCSDCSGGQHEEGGYRVHGVAGGCCERRCCGSVLGRGMHLPSCRTLLYRTLRSNSSTRTGPRASTHTSADSSWRPLPPELP